MGRSPKLLAYYAGVECGIGVYALLFPLLFGLATRLSLLVPAAHSGLAFGFDLSLCVLLIGLPAVLSLVEQNKGAVTVDSQVGEGTTFRISFPVQELAGELVTPTARR